MTTEEEEYKALPEEDKPIYRMVKQHNLILNGRDPGDFNKGAIISQLNSYVSTASNVAEFKKNIEANYNLNRITGLLKPNPVNNTPLSDDDLDFFFNWLKKACLASDITVAASDARASSGAASDARASSGAAKAKTTTSKSKTKKGGDSGSKRKGKSYKKYQRRLRKNKSKKVRRT